MGLQGGGWRWHNGANDANLGAAALTCAGQTCSGNAERSPLLAGSVPA